MINHEGYSNLYIANVVPGERSYNKIVVFRYILDKSKGTHVFEEFRGTFKDNYKTFIPDSRPNDRWYFTNALEGKICHERIFYRINDKTEEEIAELRKDALERMIDAKKAYLARLKNSIVKVEDDLKILENYKSNSN